MIRPISHLRNIIIAASAVLCVLSLSGLDVARRIPASSVSLAAPMQQTASLTLEDAAVEIAPDGIITTRATLTNTSATTDTFDISTNIADFPGWGVSIFPGVSIPLAAGESRQVDLTITAPSNASGSVYLVVSARSQQTSQVASDFVTVNVSRTSLQQTTTFSFNEDSTNINPGQQININATLQTSTGITTNEDFDISIVTQPAGWNVSVTPANPVTVSPGSPRTVSFSVTAPASATPGTSVTLRASAQSALTSQITEDSITLNIPQASPTATNTATPGNIDIQLVVRGDTEKETTPGRSVDYDLRVFNRGDERVTIRFSIDTVVNCNRDVPGCFEGFSRNNVTLDPGANADFTVNVQLPSDAQAGRLATSRVIASVDDAPEVRTQVNLTTRVIEATTTPTRTETPSRTPSPTATLGPVCEDIFENDDDRDSAKALDVNLPQPQLERDPDVDDRRAICPSGDEDWLVFGGIKGKVYTIDVRDVAAGLDLTLELFDEDGNSIAFNDDFFNRDPDNPNASDINPRIESWIAPYTGRFYIRVRDAADRGGVDRTYRIELIAESYGVTPETVIEVCEDQFEQDGLPEQARLITSNERQFDRRLCPTGDADWVTFFGKEGKRYFIYTDTRPYFNNNPVNDTFDVQAGADTVIVLTDRDGVSVLDVNDDIPGGETLDSQIEFLPEVDGFYYMQVKNVGDIGNQFIRYDLTLELCVPGTSECGRDISLSASGLEESRTKQGPVPTPGVSSLPTSTLPPTIAGEFSLDGTATPTFTPEGQ